MFKKIVEFFTGKKQETKSAHPLDAVTKPHPGHPGWPIPVPQAPYKLEPPAETTPIPYVPANEPPKCGCGRSPTGYCVGLHKLSPEQWATSTDNPDSVTKVVVPEPVKKKRTFAKKPAVSAAPVEKKPAKPRAKKPAQ
jgi:hypothetical protein